MMKEIKEIMEMHRVNGGVGILTDRGLFRVNNKTVANIYTDEIEYEPVTSGCEDLSFVKVNDGEVEYTFYYDGSHKLKLSMNLLLRVLKF